MDWQPIETAPKDGTVVLLYTGGSFPVCGAYAVFDYGYGKSDGWIYAYPILTEAHHDGISPTHWMPLPEPPK